LGNRDARREGPADAGAGDLLGGDALGTFDEPSKPTAAGKSAKTADDLSLYFSRYGGDAPGTIYESTRNGPVTWPIGAAVSGKVLQVVGTSRRRPTGVSFDRRTLFYWDEASGTERAAWRPATQRYGSAGRTIEQDGPVLTR